MSGAHRWFRAESRPLSGWLHLPVSGEAVGAAVFCAPLGHEANNAQWALQSAADRLAARGVVGVRFDYTGTGDSAGSLEDPGRFAEWRSDVDAAVSLARDLGPERVVLIGMRMGALLAAAAVTAGTAVDGLVLWDPYSTGRSFFRVEQALLAAGYGAAQPGDGSVVGPAFRYTPETVADLSRLELGPTPAGATLVLARKGDRSVARAGVRDSAGKVDWEEISGQPELLDVPPDMTVLPEGALDRVVAWTSTRLDGPPTVVRLPSAPESVRVSEADAPAVRERPVRLGPHGLFAMATEPEGSDAAAQTVVFLSAGALDHGGPGRLWVTLARRLASAGVRSVRVDFDGIGETFGRPGKARNIPKPPEAIDDVCDLVAALGDPDAAEVVLVGLSSGGYHAIEGALRLHPFGVAAINPGLASWVPEQDEGRIDPRRRAYRPMPVALRKLAVRHERIARWLWRATLQVWVGRSPNWGVAEVARRGTPMLIIVNEHDSVQFEPSLYWSIVRWVLRRRGLLSVDRVPGSDHSLYTQAGEERAAVLLTDWVLSRCGRDRRRSARRRVWLDDLQM
jgi:pimeloyl-ACP methyl ester carboxylesterase